MVLGANVENIWTTNAVTISKDLDYRPYATNASFRTMAIIRRKSNAGLDKVIVIVPSHEPNTLEQASFHIK